VDLCKYFEENANFQQKKGEAVGVVEQGVVDVGGLVDLVANLFGHCRDVDNDAGEVDQSCGCVKRFMEKKP
jgi:hypothetical protein